MPRLCVDRIHTTAGLNPKSLQTGNRGTIQTIALTDRDDERLLIPLSNEATEVSHLYP